MTTPPQLGMDEVKQKIVDYLQRVKQAVSRDIARSTKIDKHQVDKGIAELTKEEKLVYVNYGGMTYVALAGQVKDEGNQPTA